MNVEEEEKLKNFTRRELYDILMEFKGMKIEEKLAMMEKRLVQLTSCPDGENIILSRALRCFKSEFKKKWRAANYTNERFLENNHKWLNKTLELPVWSGAQKPGRPLKKFKELSNRSKLRRTKDLREHVPVEELTYAACVKEGTSGNIDTSKMMKDMLLTPTRSKKFRKIISSNEKQVGRNTLKKYTPQEALSLFVEGDFTRRQWELIQGPNKNIFPCYSLLQKAKKACYPDEDSLKVTETGFEVELQALLNHTTSRLCEYLNEVINTLSVFDKQHLSLISKWGCDGSNQMQYKQKFINSNDSDANAFISSLVPLRLIVSVNGETKKIIWQNPVPSSVRFCRPIRMRFIHETKDITKEEIAFIEEQIRNLKETEIMTSDVKVTHTLLLTMVDGKVCNAATDTASTMRCYICGQTSKDFNKLKKSPQINPEALKFGLSILHARIRFFECLLHLAYKIPLKTWQARSKETKEKVKETKEKIQTLFREEMGLIVDVPKAGYGNTNDGNTSRRFFGDPETSARITGVNIEIIKKFGVILEVISSGFDIDDVKFDEYAQDTAKFYTELYGWHPMSPTVHKILMHGATVIAQAILPIGQFSEEAAEARNKHFRKYRLDFSRKFSRLQCNKDVLNRLLLTSDPLISCNRPKKLQNKQRKPFSEEAMSLIVASPLLENNEDETTTDYESD